MYCDQRIVFADACLAAYEGRVRRGVYRQRVTRTGSQGILADRVSCMLREDNMYLQKKDLRRQKKKRSWHIEFALIILTFA